MNQSPGEVPHFVQLFVLHRIIKQFNQFQLEELNFKSNVDEKSKATNIVSSLKKYGIKTYMTDHYDETRDSHIIDLIFNKIICKHFETQYHQIISYYCNKNDDHENVSSKATQTLFNINHLMCLIFQFAFKKKHDIDNISLVCSHWFYHAFDTKSYKFFDEVSSYNSDDRYSLAIITLLKITSFNPKTHPRHRLQTLKCQWQRLCNTQSLTFRVFVADKLEITQEFLSYMSAFNNVKKLEVKLMKYDAGSTQVDNYKDQLKVLETIIDQCKDRILELKIAVELWIYDNDSNCSKQLPVLKLNNLERLQLSVDENFFPVIFSNKLKSLTIGGVIHSRNSTLSNEWIKFLMDNCDCSNITSMKIINVKFNRSRSVFNNQFKKYMSNTDFEKNVNINKVDTKVEKTSTINLINSFASKFNQLKKIEFVLNNVDRNSMHIWNFFVNALESIISTNNTVVLSDTKMEYCNNKKVTIRKTGTLGGGYLRNRLTKEFKDLTSKNASDNYTVTWDEYNEKQWNVTIFGPKGSPYENGIFELELEFNSVQYAVYPQIPPRIYFNTNIYHPNVSTHSIMTFSDYQNWGKKVKNVRELLDAIVNLLVEPDCACCNNNEAAVLYVSDREKFNQNARKVTNQFVIPN